MVKLEAVHVGQLAQVSQPGANEVKADTGMGQLALHWGGKRFYGLRLESSPLSYPANASIWDQKGIG